MKLKIETFKQGVINLPAIVALSQPCSKLPIEAAIATRTDPAIFLGQNQIAPNITVTSNQSRSDQSTQNHKSEDGISSNPNSH